MARKKSSLNKLLQELDKEELIAEIEKICDKFEIVRDYFQIDLTGDTSQYLERAKNNIKRQFNTSAGKFRKAKASNLNKIISNFEVLSIYKEDVIQLLLFRVTTTLDYIKGFHNYPKALLPSTQIAFKKACNLIADEGLTDKYKAECAKLCRRANRYFEADDMVEVYEKCFGEELEE